MAGSCRVLWLIFLPFVWVDPALFAQIGGPFPGGGYPPGGYPPGGYPPGGYPGGGGVGIPMPGGRSRKKPKNDVQPTQNLTGMLRSLNDTQLVLEAEDTRLITLKRTSKTKFLKDGDPMKPADLNPGDHLDIDATQDDQGYFTAVNVNFNKAGSSAERSKASQPVEASARASGGGSVDGDDDRPRIRRADTPTSAPDTDSPASTTNSPASSPVPQPRSAPAPAPDVASDKPLPPAKPDPDDPGPPVLRRGKPTRQTSSASRSSDEPTQIASAQTPQSTAAVNPTLQRDPDGVVPERPTITLREGQQRSPDLPPVDPTILKAMEAAESFTETLPNYVCQQFTSRFVSVTHVVSWQAQDVVSAEVVYENGREDYRNLKINDKAVKKGMEELSGAWSTGEFGTLLRDIFSPATAAEFHFRKDSAIAGKSAALYDFKVAREGSHWHIMVASQSVFPPYKGSVWIDKQNGRVLRIEMQARNMPQEFPLDTVESEADYQYVRIGGTQEFLLPVHAETLSCQRGTNNCSRNSIDFRNYKKYSGEANITFDK
jgi:hypothetical protein